MSRLIGLVAPPKRRLGGYRRARDQFSASPVFRRARDYCERTYGEWYILSTVHGLLPPQQVIGADAPLLHTLPAGERAAWAAGVAAQLEDRCQRSGELLTFVLYASQRYADLLAKAAPSMRFELPLAGMRLGQQLRWYEQQLRVQPRVLTGPLTPLPPLPRPTTE